MLDCTCYDCKKLCWCKVGQDEPIPCRLFAPKHAEVNSKDIHRPVEPFNSDK